MKSKLLTFCLLGLILYTQIAISQNIESILYQGWSNNNWVNSSKSTNTYDGNSYLTYNLQQIWEVGTSSWKNSSQINYTNNANGTVNYFISQSWDSNSSSWINSLKGIYTYNTSNKMLTITYQGWSNNNWVNSSKSTNTYDGSNYLTCNLQQIWEVGTSSWKNSGQINYTNNANGTVNYFISQSWDSNSSSWVNSLKGIYSYVQNSFIYDISENTYFLIYPNPANDKLSIDIEEKATLEIINSQGQIVDTKSLTEKVNNLDLSNIVSGVYTLRIKTDRGIAIKKLIKQ